jgi:arginyl-tRNA synthetase
MTLYARFAVHLDTLLDALMQDGSLPAGVDRTGVAVEPPRDPSHGDLAINAAMVLAKRAGTNPRTLASLIAPRLKALPEVEAAEVAGPGFINLRLSPGVWRDELAAILTEGANYGRSRQGEGIRVNVEYVSANPTGPDAHGPLPGCGGGRRARPICSNMPGMRSRANIMSTMRAGRSMCSRARCTCATARRSGLTSANPGRALSRRISEAGGAGARDDPRPRFAGGAGGRVAGAVPPGRRWPAMMDLIRADLALLGIHHDVFASEAEVQEAGKPEAAVEMLRGRGLIYEGELERPKSLTSMTNGSRWS